MLRESMKIEGHGVDLANLTRGSSAGVDVPQAADLVEFVEARPRAVGTDPPAVAANEGGQAG